MVDILTTVNRKGLAARIYHFLLDLVDDALDVIITLLTRKKRLERALTAVYNFRAAEMEMIEKCTLKHKGLRLRKNFSIENTEEILQKESVRAVGVKRIYLQTKLSDALASLAAYDALVEQVEAIRAEEYVVGNPVHEEKLLKLWHLLKPDDKISSCSGKHWTTIGFQSDEPSRDFRGMGILSLDQLIYLAKKEPKLMRSIMTLANHPRIGFPLAITDKEPSKEEIKLAERMASILKDFEARQLEVDEDEQLEVVEEEEEDWEDELMDVERQASSGHMIMFSGGALVSEERVRLQLDFGCVLTTMEEDKVAEKINEGVPQKRDNIQKVVSLVYRILCHPRVEKQVAYAWFKAGYTTSHPGLFENPSRMVFPDVIDPCREANCEETVGFIRCPHYAQCFCFMHFVPAYHWC